MENSLSALEKSEDHLYSVEKKKIHQSELFNQNDHQLLHSIPLKTDIDSIFNERIESSLKENHNDTSQNVSVFLQQDSSFYIQSQKSEKIENQIINSIANNKQNPSQFKTSIPKDCNEIGQDQILDPQNYSALINSQISGIYTKKNQRDQLGQVLKRNNSVSSSKRGNNLNSSFLIQNNLYAPGSNTKKKYTKNGKAIRIFLIRWKKRSTVIKGFLCKKCEYFCTQLRQNTEFYRLKTLNTYHLTKLNDLSVYSRFQLEKRVVVSKNNNINTWLYSMNLQDASIAARYIEAFYWSVATIMLIGAGGKNQIETTFLICTLLLTVGVFAFLISTISMILEELNKETQQYKRDLEIINRYIKYKHIGQETQQKIRGFIEYLYIDSKAINIDMQANEVLSKFPKQVKEEIYQEINTTTLSQISLIVDNFSKKTQDRLKQCMQEKCYLTNEKIFAQNEAKNTKIYLITKGNVDMYYQTSNKQRFSIGCFTKGQVIGDLNFISGYSYEYTAKCSTFVTTTSIDRNDFLEIIKQDKDDFEKFFLIQQQLQMQGYASQYPRKCCICQRVTHSEKDCNYLHYNPNRGTVFLKNQQSSNIIERKKHLRRTQKIQALNEDLIESIFDAIDYLYRDEQFLDYLDQQQELFSDTDSDNESDYYNIDLEQLDEMRKNEGNSVISNKIMANNNKINQNDQTEMHPIKTAYEEETVSKTSNNKFNNKKLLFKEMDSDTLSQYSIKQHLKKNNTNNTINNNNGHNSNIQKQNSQHSIGEQENYAGNVCSFDSQDNRKQILSSRNIECQDRAKYYENNDKSKKQISSQKLIEDTELQMLQKQQQQSILQQQKSRSPQMRPDRKKRVTSLASQIEIFSKSSSQMISPQKPIKNAQQQQQVFTPQLQGQSQLRSIRSKNSIVLLNQNCNLAGGRNIMSRKSVRITGHQQEELRQLLQNNRSSIQLVGGKELNRQSSNNHVGKFFKEIIQENENDWFFLNFDKQQTWKIYYPQFNLPVLVQKYKQIQKIKNGIQQQQNYQNCNYKENTQALGISQQKNNQINGNSRKNLNIMRQMSIQKRKSSMHSKQQEYQTNNCNQALNLNQVIQLSDSQYT